MLENRFSGNYYDITYDLTVHSHLHVRFTESFSVTWSNHPLLGRTKTSLSISNTCISLLFNNMTTLNLLLISITQTNKNVVVLLINNNVSLYYSRVQLHYY